jgi:predicted ATP-dependent endonuclease of OLD family
MFKKLKIENFTLIENDEIKFSKNINVFIGKNSSGKTHMMKLLYSIAKTYESVDDIEKSKSKFGLPLTKELLKNFMISKIGKLSSRVKGHSISKIEAYNFEGESLNFTIAPKKSELEITQYIKNFSKSNSSIYIPTKEILTMFQGFVSKYLEGDIHIEKMYFDLAVKLGIPIKMGGFTNEQKKLIEPIEKIMKGKIIYDNKSDEFYLQQKGLGRIEIGLVAEGYRKLGQILHLIGNKTLSNDSIMFWDEPEVNLNPSYSENIVELLSYLSKDTQIFIATHDYFMLKYLDLEAKKNNIQINYFSFYKEKDTDKFVKIESRDSLDEIKYNPIIDEFEHLFEKLSKDFYA